MSHSRPPAGVSHTTFSHESNFSPDAEASGWDSPVGDERSFAGSQSPDAATAVADLPASARPDNIPEFSSFQEAAEEIHRVAAVLFEQKPDWVTFFRETLGVQSITRHVFSTLDEWRQFEQTAEFISIQKMLATLRGRVKPRSEEPPPQEHTRVITVRLPESLHEALKTEAHAHKTSVNKLCISKLLQMIDDDVIV